MDYASAADEHFVEAAGILDEVPAAIKRRGAVDAVVLMSVKVAQVQATLAVAVAVRELREQLSMSRETVEEGLSHSLSAKYTQDEKLRDAIRDAAREVAQR